MNLGNVQKYPQQKKQTQLTKPEIAVAMIKKASRPLLIVGSYATERYMEGKQLIEYLIDFAKASKVPVVATAHMVGEFLKRGYNQQASCLQWTSATDWLIPMERT